MAVARRGLLGRGLAYRFAGSERQALRDVDIDVGPGRRVAVIGANGSGKSTLLKLLKGLLVPAAGDVSIDGHGPAEPDPTRGGAPAHLGVGYVFQDPDNQIVAALVDEDVAFGPENLGIDGEELAGRVRDSLAAVGLWDMAAREPHSLSGGEKQRLAIAGALALQPGYLLLDEPTSMLDPVGRAQVRAVVAELQERRGVGVLEVTHELADALEADEVIVLSAGATAARGTPRAVLSDVRCLERAGLAPLPATRLALAMRREGAAVPADAFTLEEVMAAL